MDLRSVSVEAIPGSMPQHEALSAWPLTSAAIRLHVPDAHWLVVREGLSVARASLWWTDLPPWPEARFGYIGHYAAADGAAGRALLVHAASELAGRGCTLAVGPIDGSTWRSYRLVVEAGGRPPYFLEPQNPPDWPDHFRAAGFDTFATYTSALVETIDPTPPRVAAAAARLEAAGYRFRALDLSALERELHQLFEVSLAAFADNLLYSPIAELEFLAQYQAILPKIDPRLVLLAERDGRIVGYVFALPDLLETARDGRAHTVIVKTLAVHPDHAGGGIGGVLTDRAQQVGRALGFTRVIHALMEETNVSQRISHRYGHPFRRYALFARPLP
jgi:GNAT superfamily N-acetyltransferase